MIIVAFSYQKSFKVINILICYKLRDIILNMKTLIKSETERLYEYSQKSSGKRY
jgi:hypothetical protein